MNHPADHELVIGSKAVPPAARFAVLNKQTGEVLAHAPAASRESVDLAVATVADVATRPGHWPAHERKRTLHLAAQRLVDARERWARTLALETGKPIRDARSEVERAATTLQASAEECGRLGGEFQPLDGVAPGAGWATLTRRAPVGAVLLITPFNFPLNLAVHKVGPALAAGCPFILKPDPRTPLTSLMLGELLRECGMPGPWGCVLPVVDDQARDALVSDPRLAMISFTGSCKVGWMLRARAGSKRVALELGGVAPCIIDETNLTASISAIAARAAFGAFVQAGQSCISVQRVIVHRAHADAVREGLCRSARGLVAGDLLSEATTLGPLISEAEALRVEALVNDARARGATLLTGGTRRGPLLDACVLEGVPDGHPLRREEVFGPVVTIEPFDEFEQAMALANDTEFGLQAGLFTTRLDRALHAWHTLQFGGLVINDIPTRRIDPMPYGGIKQSGLGREGVHHAALEFTELRTLLLEQNPALGS